MSKAQQYQEIIIQTNEWFDKKVESLKSLNNTENKIFFQSNDGEQIDLPADLKKGFLFGIQTAIEILGDFPVKITKDNDSN